MKLERYALDNKACLVLLLVQASLTQRVGAEGHLGRVMRVT